MIIIPQSANEWYDIWAEFERTQRGQMRIDINLGGKVEVELGCRAECLLEELIEVLREKNMAHEEFAAKLEEVDLNVQEVQSKLTQYFDIQSNVVTQLNAEIERLKGLVDDPAELDRLAALSEKLRGGVQAIEDAVDAKLSQP